MHVNVFQLRAEWKLIGFQFVTNFLQTHNQLIALHGADQTDVRQHPRVRDRAHDIVHVQSPVDPHTLGERVDTPIRCRRKYTRSGWSCHRKIFRNEQQTRVAHAAEPIALAASGNSTRNGWRVSNNLASGDNKIEPIAKPTDLSPC